MLKSILKIAGIFMLLIIAVAFAAPIFFKGKILTLVKSEINKNLQADVGFHDLDISLFRNFPRLSAGLEGFFITGRDEFRDDTLIAARRIDIALNLFSVIIGKNKIDAIILDEPRIHALINKEGRANWDITVPDTLSVETTPSSAFSLELSRYEIRNGFIEYSDIPGNMFASIGNLNHTGKGNFKQDRFTLSTKTEAGFVNFLYEKIPYLVQTKASIETDINIDNKTSTYTFSTGKIKLNELILASEGFFQVATDTTYKMDIRFSAPSTDFRTLLSLIPAVYKQDYDKIKTEGSANFTGWVKGIYSSVEMPGYELNLEVKDGMFRYPDLPEPVKDINLVMKLDNPDGISDHTIIDISRAHISFGKESFDFRLLLKNPETVRYLDAAAKGKLDLSQVSHFVKLDPGTKLAGMIDADIFAKGNFSAIEQGNGDFRAGGYLDISELRFASTLFPVPVQHGRMHIGIENTGGIADKTMINISPAHIELGNHPVDFTLQLSRPVTEMIFSGTIKGNFPLDRVKQFTTLEPGSSVSGMLKGDLAFSGTKEAINNKQYDKIDLHGNVQLSNLQYASRDYPDGIHIISSAIQFSPQQLNLQSFEGQYMGIGFTASGVLHNIIGYALENQVLDGKLVVKADRMNMNDWMGPKTNDKTANSGTSAISVPSNLDLELHATADEVKYDKVSYKNVQGTLFVKNETVKLQDVQTEALDGQISVNGSYSTRESKQEPAIAMDYTVRNVDIQQAFYAYNTVQRLMPVGKFISGRVSSEMKLTGVLGKDMMPDLSTLTGSGNLLLLDGVLKKFAPVEHLAADLGITELQEISLKDIKNYFQFSQGKMLVKPFNVQVEGIKMQIGGMQGIDQSMDYLLLMKLPRSLMGSKGNNLVNGLVSQANARGIPVSVGDEVDLNIKMEGTITRPVIKIDMKQTASGMTDAFKAQASAFAQQKTDSVKQVVSATGKSLKDSATSLKEQTVKGLKQDLINKLTNEKDSSATDFGTMDKTKKSAEQTLKNTFNGLMRKKKQNKDSSGK